MQKFPKIWLIYVEVTRKKFSENMAVILCSFVGMQSDEPHAISGVRHDVFDINVHYNLLIDLNNLPHDQPMMQVHQPTAVPYFIIGPLGAFSLIVIGASSSTELFLTNYDNCTFRNPTPYHPDCRICVLVQWVLENCPSVTACVGKLLKETPLNIFEVNREIWCRLYPKPIEFSKSFLRYSSKIDYFMILKKPFYVYPISPSGTCHYNLEEKKRLLLEWRNGLSYLAHRSLKRKGEKCGRVASYILEKLQSLFTKYIVKLFNNISELDSDSPYYVLDSVRLSSYFSNVFEDWAISVGTALCDMEYENPESHPGIIDPRATGYLDRKSYTFQVLVGICITTLFALNCPAIYNYDGDIASSYFHNSNCQLDWRKCYCRFALYLQNEWLLLCISLK